MQTELVRAVIAAPSTLLLMGSLRGRWSRSPGRIGISLVLMTAALAPFLGGWHSWAVIAVVLITAPVFARRTLISILVLVELLIVTAAAAALTDETRARHAIAHVGSAQGVVIVLGGLVLSVFVAGELIAIALTPFADKLSRVDERGLANAGRVIGWLERILLYGLILAGAADAAAIVIAAKSVARFPAFRKEAFAEYYLIGTLLSFLLAGLIGAAARAALGLPLLSMVS